MVRQRTTPFFVCYTGNDDVEMAYLPSGPALCLTARPENTMPRTTSDMPMGSGQLYDLSPNIEIRMKAAPLMAKHTAATR